MDEAEVGSVLKRTLKSLCRKYGWSYGVFWGYDQRNSILLTMEEAYHEEQTAAMVDNMLLQVHMLGEGTIGEVALTGKHKWVFSDAHSKARNPVVPIAGEDPFQDDSGFHSQFTSRIKTIAVIPVESRGVVQFGSTKEVPENLEFVDQTRRLSQKVGNCDETIQSDNYRLTSLNSETYDINAMFASLISSENLATGGSRELMRNHVQSTSSIENSITNAPCVSAWSSEASILTPFEQQLGSKSMILDYPNFCSMEANAFVDENFQSFLGTEVGFPEVTTSLHGLTEEFTLPDFETDLSNPFSLDDLSQWFTPSPEQSTKPMGPTTEVNTLNPTGVSSVLPGLVKDNVVSHPSNSVQSSISDPFVAENDLFDGLGLEFGECWENYIKPTVSSNCHTVVNTSAMSECVTQVDGSPPAGPRKGLFSELGLAELINGVQNSSSANRFSFEDQLSTNKRRKIETLSSNNNQSQLPKFPSSCGSMSLIQHFFNQDKNSLPSQKDVLPKPQVGLRIDDCFSINAGNDVVATPKKTEKPMKVNKKRARPGESTRPRPKDRQQIQDRLKELRGIIPNGAKCSIDSLLDLTIKHMLFLQSVTKYADKLKEADEPKLTGQENGVVLKDNGVAGQSGGGNGGATWAFEVGDQNMLCPIIVEDLSQPGQMLIEMLCEERGFFLEIADVVRGLGLDICKGVMEVRDDKIWARFIVEANKEVTRMDVFWSLVQLLQQTNTSSIDSTDQTSNHAMNGGFSLADIYHQTLQPLAASHQLC